MKAGESKDTVFNITTEELKFYDINLKWIYESGDFEVLIGENSKDVKKARLKPFFGSSLLHDAMYNCKIF